MTTVPELKRFLLRALRAAGGGPLHQEALEYSCMDLFRPAPLLSDVHDAFRELQRGGFILGTTDPLDENAIRWGLTELGVHQAKQLK